MSHRSDSSAPTGGQGGPRASPQTPTSRANPTLQRTCATHKSPNVQKQGRVQVARPKHHTMRPSSRDLYLRGSAALRLALPRRREPRQYAPRRALSVQAHATPSTHGGGASRRLAGRRAATQRAVPLAPMCVPPLPHRGGAYTTYIQLRRSRDHNELTSAGRRPGQCRCA